LGSDRTEFQKGRRLRVGKKSLVESGLREIGSKISGGKRDKGGKKKENNENPHLR